MGVRANGDAPMWNDEERWEGVKAVAAMRVLAVPAFLLVCLGQDEAKARVLVLIAAVYSAVNLAEMVVFFGPSWRRLPLPPLIVCDAAVIALAMEFSGGGSSDARYLALTVMVATSTTLPRRTLLRTAAFGLTLIALPVLLDPGSDVNLLASFSATAFGLAVAFTLALVSERVTARQRSLADERRTLLANALDAEHGVRRVLAQDVHDRALQTLLTARQDLEEAALGDAAALAQGRAQVNSAITAVRDAVHELHAGALAGQLPQALRALVVRTQASGVVAAQAHIQTGSGRHDELLYAVARDLVADALEHPGTTKLDVGLWRDEDDIVLEVADDGARTETAGVGLGLRLATSSERLAEAGGSLWISTPADGGTSVRARLPA